MDSAPWKSYSSSSSPSKVIESSVYSVFKKGKYLPNMSSSSHSPFSSSYSLGGSRECLVVQPITLFSPSARTLS